MFHGMEYVYEVYKEKSFSKAANNLFISQPSLSATVKRIEEKIGYPLFDRSTKPLGLTECGEEYIKYVEQIMAVEKEFAEYINDWGNLKRGKMVLGGSSLFSSWVIPPLIGDFKDKYPQIQIEVVEESTAKLAQRLRKGDIDLVLGNEIPDKNIFDCCVYQKERLLLVVPEDFSINRDITAYRIPGESIRNGKFLLNGTKPVPMELFKEQPFIMLKPDNDTRRRTLEICQAAGFTPRVLFELDQQMTAYNITSSGMGISIIGDSLLSRVPPNPKVVYYRIASEISERELYFYWKKGRYISRAMEAFLQLSLQNPSVRRML